MARLNTQTNRMSERTHEGAPAYSITAWQQLRRSVLSCFLWEDEFYEDGKAIADRIVENARKVAPHNLAALAIEARSQYHLRHVPLLLLTILAETGSGSSLVSRAIADTIMRADELAELVAIYWRNGKRPLSAQMKKGLAEAFKKFDRYQLSKYNRDGIVKLRDVMFLVHPKPNAEQVEMWKELAENSLSGADTWEVGLSTGGDKKETFERLMREGKLGYLALLRNLRNMEQAGVDRDLVRAQLLARKGAHNVLPFRYLAAARACPSMEPILDQALSEALSDMPLMPGKTAVVVDCSGSMGAPVSGKSQMTRFDVAGVLGGSINGDVRLFAFGTLVREVPARRGMAGVDVLRNANVGHATNIGEAVRYAQSKGYFDRIIVITDEQSRDKVPGPKGKGYMINVASAKNGVGYGPWVHIDGFSEAVLRFISEYERDTETA